MLKYVVTYGTEKELLGPVDHNFDKNLLSAVGLSLPWHHLLNIKIPL